MSDMTKVVMNTSRSTYYLLLKNLFGINIWVEITWSCQCAQLISSFPKQSVFYDRMTVHRNRLLVNKTNRRTEFQFYLYYDSTCFGQPFCPSSGVLSRTSTLIYFMQLWWPFATRSRMDDGQKSCPKHV